MPSGPQGAATGPGGRDRVPVPRWLVAVSLLTLIGFLGLLIAAVDVGVQGAVPLSNELTVGSLASMAVFAIVNLSQQRSLARPTRAS